MTARFITHRSTRSAVYFSMRFRKPSIASSRSQSSSEGGCGGSRESSRITSKLTGARLCCKMTADIVRSLSCGPTRSDSASRPVLVWLPRPPHGLRRWGVSVSHLVSEKPAPTETLSRPLVHVLRDPVQRVRDRLPEPLAEFHDSRNQQQHRHECPERHDHVLSVHDALRIIRSAAACHRERVTNRRGLGRSAAAAFRRSHASTWVMNRYANRCRTT